MMELKPKRAFVFADDRSIRALVALDCKELTEREARIAGHVDLSSIKEGMVVRPADSEFKSDRTVAYIVANVEQKKGGDSIIRFGGVVRETSSPLAEVPIVIGQDEIEEVKVYRPPRQVKQRLFSLAHNCRVMSGGKVRFAIAVQDIPEQEAGLVIYAIMDIRSRRPDFGREPFRFPSGLVMVSRESCMQEIRGGTGAIRVLEDDNDTRLQFIVKGMLFGKPISEDQATHFLREIVPFIIGDFEKIGWLQPADDNSAERSSGGRPLNPDDDWAFQEIMAKERDQMEVYRDWLKRIPVDRKRKLADPLDSFKKQINYRRRRGEKKEKRE